MDRTVIAVIMMIAGSFTLGFLTAWHYWSVRLTRHNRILMSLNGIIQLYKEYIGNMQVPNEAQKHMKDATNVHNEMKELLAQIEQPNKNSSHALHKNKLRQQLMELNVKRLQYLQAAVDAGYDPLMEFKGQLTRMSEVIELQRQEAASVMDKTPKPPQPPKVKKPEPPAKLSKPRHLSVIKD